MNIFINCISIKAYTWLNEQLLKSNSVIFSISLKTFNFLSLIIFNYHEAISVRGKIENYTSNFH